MADDNSDERFPPTNGRALGVFGLLLGLGFAVGAPVTDIDGAWVWSTVGLLVVVLMWSGLLRPVVLVEGDDLVLRNMLDTVRVPLAAIDTVAVGQVLAVFVDDDRYVAPSIGRTRRQLHGRALPGQMVDAPQLPDVGLFVEQRIQHRVETARKTGAEPGPVVRAWAWPEIAALSVAVVLVVVAVVL